MKFPTEIASKSLAFIEIPCSKAEIKTSVIDETSSFPKLELELPTHINKWV